MPENDSFDSRLRAHLARQAQQAADPAAARRLVAAAGEAVHRGGARGHRLMPLVAGVAAAALLAAALTTAALLHGRRQSTAVPPVASPSASASPLLVPPAPSLLPSAPASAAATPALPAPNLAVDGLTGPLSPDAVPGAMASGPGLPVVLYAERTADCSNGYDTYVWDGTRWYRSTQGGGPRLLSAAMTWDPLTGHLLLVGDRCDLNSSPSPSPAASPSPTPSGPQATPSATSTASPSATPTPAPPPPPAQTWQWQPSADKLGGSWQMLHPAYPPYALPGRHSLAYDAPSHRTLALVQNGYRDTVQSEVWTWDGRNWSRAWHDCLLCSGNSYMSASTVVQSPGGGAVAIDTSVYAWTGSGWVKTGGGLPASDSVISGRSGAVYDAATRQDLLVTTSNLYAYDGTRVTASPLPQALQGRYGPGFAAGTNGGQEAVLWGGQRDQGTDHAVTLRDTWVYAAGRWRLAG